MPDLEARHAGFPSLTAKTEQTSGVTSASTNYTTVTAGSTAHTKGSWTQINGSTTERTIAVIFLHMLITQNALFDIGTGAAGSEVVVIPNIHVSSPGARSMCPAGPYFINIPKGTRVAVRCQSATASATYSIGIAFCQNPPSPQQFTALSYPIQTPDYLENAGMDTSTSFMTTITAGASAHTKGSWTQLLASTTGRVVAIAIHTRGGATDVRYLVDIGIGAAGSETVLVADLGCESSGAWIPSMFLVLIVVAPGTRIAARCQASTASSTINYGLILMEKK